jgi:hypothetical protein
MRTGFFYGRENKMALLLLLCLLCVILTLVYLVILQRRIDRFAGQIEEIRSNTYTAHVTAYLAWHAVLKVMRNLAAEVPSDRWPEILDEVLHEQIEPSTGRAGLGQSSASGGGTDHQPEARPAEGDDQQSEDV